MLTANNTRALTTKRQQSSYHAEEAAASIRYTQRIENPSKRRNSPHWKKQDLSLEDARAIAGRN
jgi:hypothetical protein